MEKKNDHVVIVGMGYVGAAMAKVFPGAIAYDPPQGLNDPAGRREHCRLAIICVPTPQGDDGSCDVRFVDQAIAELPRSIPLVLIKSTVPPGTTEHLGVKYSRRIAFSPEYVGEGGYPVPAPFPDPHDPRRHGFMVIGGPLSTCSAIIDIFLPVLGPATRFRPMASRDAELVKYMENAFLAFKVCFANEMRHLVECIGGNYHMVREGWLDDARVGLSHSAAFAERPGFDGKCLPKDVAALLATARLHDVSVPLLEAVLAVNAKQREEPSVD